MNYMPREPHTDPVPAPRDPGPAGGTMPRYRHWDDHLVCIRDIIRQWERGDMPDANALRAIASLIDDRKQTGPWPPSNRDSVAESAGMLPHVDT